MHARSRKSYVYFRSIFVARAWFEIPPELGQSSNQTGLAHRTSIGYDHPLTLLVGMFVPNLQQQQQQPHAAGQPGEAGPNEASIGGIFDGESGVLTLRLDRSSPFLWTMILPSS